MSKTIGSFPKAFDDLCRVEIEEGLFDEKWLGVPLWEVLRFPFFQLSLSRMGIMQPDARMVKDKNKLESTRLKKIPAILGELLRLATSRKYQKKYVIIGPGVSRMRKRNGYYESAYFSKVIEFLGERNCILIEPNDSTLIRRKDIRHNNLIFASSIKALGRLSVLCNRNERELREGYQKVEAIIERLVKHYFFASEFRGQARNIVRQFVIHKAAYKNFLLKNRPDVVLMLTSYGKESIISACKDLSIKTIEFQHGTISKLSPQYYFPLGTKKTLAPDYFFSYGSYFTDILESSNFESHVVTFGNPEREELKPTSPQGTKSQILIISQWTLREKLIEFTQTLAKNWGGRYNIVFRLHPNESFLIHDVEKKFCETGVRVVQPSNGTLADAQLESEFQIGVYSTALFEGLTLGCKTLVLDIPGVEHFDSAIEKGWVKKISGASEFSPDIKFSKFENTQLNARVEMKQLANVIKNN